jgi:N-methylhydantoinase A
MRELEIENFVVPAIPPGVFSAWGMLNTDIKHSKVFTDITRLDREKAVEKINENFCSLENEVFDLFTDHLEQPKLERFADVRYYGQEHTVRIPISLETIDSNRLNEIIQLFHIHHEREYEFKLPNDPIEIVNYQVVGTIPITHLEQEEYKNPEIIEEEKVRKVYLDGRYMEVPIFNRYKIMKDAQIQGPTIIEGPTSTIIILDKQTASLDIYGNIIVRRVS